MADFPKKQQQCLIPKYLLDYLGQLDENHPDPSAEWGGQGTTYTAGDGIIIDDDTISVDNETVAMVSNLSTVAFSGSYSDLSNKPDLSVYELKEDAFKVLDFTSYSGAQTSQELWEALEDTWPRVIVKYYDNYFVPETDLLPYNSDYRLTCVHTTRLPDIQTQKETYEISVNKLDINEYSAFQDTTITVTNDYDDLVNQPTIPVVPTNVSAFTNDAGYITETYADNAAADAFKVLDFTNYQGQSGQKGLFTDLQNAWPKVIVQYYDHYYMPMEYNQYEPSYALIYSDGNTYNPILANPEMFVTLSKISINRYWVTETDSTVSNDYNDLTNKPTIPEAVSGTNDGTNWTSLTIGNDTYGLASGGGASYTAGTGIDITNNEISIDNTVALKTDIPSNYVTTNTAQELTGVKTFSGAKLVNFKLGSNEANPAGFTCYDYSNNERANLQFGVRTVSGSTDYYLTLGNYSSNPNLSKVKVGFRLQDNFNNIYNFIMPTGTTSNFTNAGYTTSANNYIPCSFTNGSTVVNADSVGSVNISSLLPTVPTTATSTSTSTVTPTTTQLIFTYTDDTTETITLMTGASVSTTTNTTLS